VVSAGGTNDATCAATTTTNTTNLNAATSPATDREYLFDPTNAPNTNPVTATVNGLIDGYGIAITNAQTTGTTTTFTNNSTITLTAGVPSAGGTAALNITGDGGLVTYNGTGAVNDGAQGTDAIVITNSGGGINFTSANGAITASGGIAISAADTGGGVTIDLTGGTGGVSGSTIGISATDSGMGAVTVTTGDQTVTGGSGEGILATNTGGGAVIVTTGSALVSSTGAAGILAAGGDVTVTIGAGGASGTIGVSAQDLDGGLVTVNGANGPITGTAAEGIRAWSTASGTVTVDMTGTGGITGQTIGVSAFTNGATAVSVNVGNNAVTGTTAQGILATSAGGTVNVTTGTALVQGNTVGVEASTTGASLVTVNVGSGGITGTNNEGIKASSVGGGVTVAFGVAGGAVSGGTVGVSAIDTGVGPVQVTGINGVITGTLNEGILAQSAGGGVTIDLTGATAGITGNTVGISASDSAAGAVSVTTGNQTVTGNAGIGIMATAVGAGTVTVTANSDVSGLAGSGIATSAVDGSTTVNANSGTVTGTGTGNAGISATATGAGNIVVNVANAVTVTGGTTTSGIRLSQTGTGSNTINNNAGASILGAGTLADPVISSATTGVGTTTTITNAVGSLISSTNATANNRPADLAIYSPVTTGAFTINNNGTLTGRIGLTDGADIVTNTGTWNLRDNGGSVAAAFGLGQDTINNNSGIINAGNALATATTTFTGIEVINNNGTGVLNAGLFGGAGNITSFTSTAAGGMAVSNSGSMNIRGLLNFSDSSVSTSAFTNTGTINMQTGTNVTTDLMTLGVSAAANTYTPGNTFNWIGGGTLQTDTNLGAVSSTGANVPSDRLLINGTATGTTNIALNDTNTGPGSYNPAGITLAGVNGASANAFKLTNLTCGGVNITGYCAATGDLLETGYGPMGAIKKGFWVYPLLQTGTAAAADGLSSPNASEYRLYGVPDTELFQLPVATAGAQNIFFSTMSDWYNRQSDLYRWINHNSLRANDSVGGGSASALNAAPGYVATTGPGLWIKASGSWTSLNNSASLANIVPVGGLPDVDTSFKQDTYSLMGGYDIGREAVFTPSDTVVGGIMAGYVSSKLTFKSSPTSITYSGGTVGVSAAYLNKGFFVDALIKADFLRLSMDFPSLNIFGFSETTVNATNIGGQSDFGYRINWGRVYVEPSVTLAYAETTIDNFSALGTNVAFNNGESFRGAAGARVGSTLFQTATHTFDVSLTARVWDEFTSKNGVVLTTSGPPLTLDDQHNPTYGELIAGLDFANRGVGWSGFMDVGTQFNNQFTTITARAGTRYQW
jgi:outer membrane autotransporter protein